MADSIKVKFKKNNNIATYPVTIGECIENLEGNADYKAVKDDVAVLKAKTSNISNDNVNNMQTDISTIKQEIAKLQTSDNTKTNQIADILNKMVTVVDDLFSSDSTKALSANQGKVLKGLVDGKAGWNVLRGTNENPIDIDSLVIPGIYDVSLATNFPKNISTYSNNDGIVIVTSSNHSYAGFNQLWIPKWKNPDFNIYTRGYIDGRDSEEWEDWKVLSNNYDTGWLNITDFSGVNYASYYHPNGGSGCTAWVRQVGNVVTITGALMNTKEIGANNDYGAYKLFTLPNEISRPKTTYRSVQQGSGANRWVIDVQTNGHVMLERYGASSVIAVPEKSWLVVDCTYICE